MKKELYWISSFCVCDFVEESKLCKRIYRRAEKFGSIGEPTSLYYFLLFLDKFYIYQIVYGWNACLLSQHFLQNYLCKCCLYLRFEWKIKESINISPSKSSRFYGRVCLVICFYSSVELLIVSVFTSYYWWVNKICNFLRLLD